MPPAKTVEWGYRPLSVYRPFHSSTARQRLIVGGMGSGKTIALCADAIARALRVPGIEIVMSRKTAPELRDTLEVEFINTMPSELFAICDRRRSGGHYESIVFPNGSRVRFRAIDDWQKHKSLNIGHLYYDELTEFDQVSYNGMMGRVRQVNPSSMAVERGYHDLIPEGERGVTAATNPAGHDWVWGHFVNEPDGDSRYWTATSLDNPHLPEDFIEGMLQLPDAWVKRFVLCSFDSFGGMIYPEWTYDTHVLKQALVLTKTTPIWQGFDPGGSGRHPQGMLWAAYTGGGLVAVHEEWHSENDVDWWADRAKKVEANLPPVLWRVGDPNAMHVRDRGTMVSLHAQYRRKGMNFANGPSQHKDRIPMLGQLVKQRRFRATRDCPTFFDQMQSYRWEDLTTTMRNKLGTHAEDYGPESPVKAFDDLVDPAQYLSSRLVQSPRQLQKKRRKQGTPWQEESLDIRARMKRSRAKKARYTGADGVIV